MANHTENYNLVKPTMAETADIRTLNGNMDTVDAIMHDTQVSMADAFDSTKSYAIREKCMYEFKLYQCIHPHTGPWDAGDFERVNAADTGGNYVEITPTYNNGLKIADTNIDGDQDEIVVPYFRGATSQENGTGGAVPAPTSSDVGKFLSSNGGWETPSGGGGGTTVVPNPVGEPTDELETVRIGDTIFSIPGSGGGGGFKETILWSGNDSATMPLTEAIDSFDAILFVGNVSEGGSNYMVSNIWSVQDINDHINDGMKFCAIANDAWYVYVTAPNTQTFTKQNQNILYISEIRGLNFGNGGSGYSSTKIWDYVDDNNGTIPYGTYTETLRDDINNYNVIILEFASARSDLTNVNWDSTVFVTLDVKALNNAWNPNKTNITSFGERSSRFYIHDNVLQKTTDNQGDTNGLIRVYGIKYGGGSGSGGGYSETDLFVNTGSSNPSSIVMNDSIQNYDEIVFKTTRNAYGNTYKLQYRYLTSELELGDQIQCWCWGPNNEYFSYVLTAFDTFSNMAQGNALLCTKIIGIKH